MGKRPIAAQAAIESQELIRLKNDLNSTIKFLKLVRFLDELPQMEKTAYDATRSLYQAVSKGRDISTLEKKLEAFFGPPRKASGTSMPISLRFNPAIKYLRGIRNEQSLFLKKTKEGFFYGALWPWSKTPVNITVHLGYVSNKMSKKDYNDLEKLVKTNVLNEKIFKAFDEEKEGRIYGISLASFLKMAMFEKISCTLEIKSAGKSGRLYMLQGELIAAETGRLKNKAAAYEIISWKNTAVELREKSRKKSNEINQGLLQILSEALKVRNEGSQDRRAFGRAGRADEKQKPTDERYKKFLGSVQKPGIKKLLLVSAMVFVVLIFIAVGAVFSVRVIKQGRLKNEYKNLLVQTEELSTLEEKEMLLEEYVNSHPPNAYTEELKEKIWEIQHLMEEQDFQSTLKNVAKLSIDSSYEKKATAIYTEYLSKYPEGTFAEEIQLKIAQIPSLIDDIEYKQLAGVAQSEYGKRIDAYLSYLSKHPGGQHVSAVEELIADTGEEYYDYLIREVDLIEQQKQWDRGIELCTRFIDIFKNNYHLDEVFELKTKLQEQKDYDFLMAHIKRAGKNYWLARKAYYSFLAKHPDTDKKDEINNELSKIAKKIDEIKKWETVLKYSKNEQHSLAERIYALENYISYTSSGPYIDYAKPILSRLKNRNLSLKHQQSEKQHSRQQAQIQREKDRIKRERDKIKTMLNKTGRRYVSDNDGTFTDTNTGLKWCLLDSRAALNKCLDYKSAQKYVNSLKTGGYRDWRLPDASELASLYKKEPSFPDKRATWYWTSEIFIKGHHKKALIVTSKRENVYTRRGVNLGKCGWVRAVRP
ncbi:MAG: DUF1566 domain-containing protein [Thermodesulfobacteriota bacterium]|nr:DUF1566 domain-containing protein [Thermodesulfobacteriota bacterium]